MVEIVKDEARGGLEKVVLRSESVSWWRWREGRASARAAQRGDERGGGAAAATRSRPGETPTTTTNKQGATAEVFLYGSHVVSWKEPDGKVRGGGGGEREAKKRR
jgi:hypothetical protein